MLCPDNECAPDLITKMSPINLFQSYNYYHSKGASIKSLTEEEKGFYSFCCDNHDDICSEECPEDILTEAATLYNAIMDA